MNIPSVLGLRCARGMGYLAPGGRNTQGVQGRIGVAPVVNQTHENLPMNGRS